MKPFLYSIAEAYLANEPDRLLDYCFVFPNKRSAVVFNHAFARAAKDLQKSGQQSRLTPHPAVMTVSDLIGQTAGGLEADRLELIFVLYQAYCEVIREFSQNENSRKAMDSMLDFNRFQRWADMLLADFNDVDMYMVDKNEIFPNVKRYREISANYIDPELIEIIRRHWPESQIPDFNLDTFWEHISHPSGQADSAEKEGDGEVSGGSGTEGVKEAQPLDFLRLWQILLHIYDRFRRKLREKNLYYPGMATRDAVRIVHETPAEGFRYRRYIFVGFTMLTEAERQLFTEMKKKRSDDSRRFADFYFDNASPALRDVPSGEQSAVGILRQPFGNSRTDFIGALISEFPPLYDCVEPVENFPKIDIVSVASGIGQAKVAGQIVRQLYPQDVVRNPDFDTNALRRTAIVLPQISMVSPIISALPEWITDINLTMGYRLRNSQVSGLVRNIVSLHLRSRLINNEVTYFIDDVRKVLSHPLIQLCAPEQSKLLILKLNAERIWTVGQQMVANLFPGLLPLFPALVNTGSSDEVFGYFEELFTWLLNSWKPQAEAADPQDTATRIDLDGGDLSQAREMSGYSVVDRVLLNGYLATISRMKALMKEYFGTKEIAMREATLFQLLERVVANQTVRYEGRPLSGLQVMGVLEARSLDYENIILPSMSESIFRQSSSQRSFIPHNLRVAFGMPTQDHQESIYAYYFYRMISRARRVFLLFDSRPDSRGGGQMSRFLSQLKYLYKPKGLSEHALGFKVTVPEHFDLYVRKTPEIMEQLQRYLTPGSNKYLSASAINQYINCPLSFYLSYIAGYKREDEVTDYMDSSTYGTIIHNTMQDLYTHACKAKKSHRITRGDIDSLKDNKGRKDWIDFFLRKNVNIEYNRWILTESGGEPCMERSGNRYDLPGPELSGDARILANVMRKYIIKLLERDAQAGDFDFLAAEYGFPMVLSIPGPNGESMDINFKFSIDRVDRLYTRRPDGSVDSEGVLRLIDYKTGADQNHTSSVDHMFDPDNDQRNKALLQLYLYDRAFRQGRRKPDNILADPFLGEVNRLAGNYDGEIQPWIYVIRSVFTEPLSCATITVNKKKRPIPESDDYYDLAGERLYDVVSRIFDPTVPFSSAASDHPCKYCKFAELCRRNPS